MYIITMKTMTEAIKGKRILGRMGIDSQIVNLDANITKGGCAYGIRCYGGEISDVIRHLEDGAVGYGHVIGRW